MNTDIFGTAKRTERLSAPTATWHESTWDLLQGLEVHEEDIPTHLLPAEWPVGPITARCAGG